MTNDNSRAHACLTQFHITCDEYNEHGLMGGDYAREIGPYKPVVSLLRVTQSMTIEALELFRLLQSKEDCEAVRAYITFAHRILLRLSYLIKHGRRETLEERQQYWEAARVHDNT